MYKNDFTLVDDIMDCLSHVYDDKETLEEDEKRLLAELNRTDSMLIKDVINLLCERIRELEDWLV